MKVRKGGTIVVNDAGEEVGRIHDAMQADAAAHGIGRGKIVDVLLAGAATRAVVLLAAAVFHARPGMPSELAAVLRTAKVWMDFVDEREDGDEAG